MPKLAIKPTTEPSIKYDSSLIEIPIKKKGVSMKIFIHSSLLRITPIPTKLKQRTDQLMFLRCLLCLRDYLSKVEFCCSLEEMEFVTGTVARRLCKVLNKTNFEQQIALVALGLSQILSI